MAAILPSSRRCQIFKSRISRRMALLIWSGHQAWQLSQLWQVASHLSKIIWTCWAIAHQSQIPLREAAVFMTTWQRLISSFSTWPTRLISSMCRLLESSTTVLMQGVLGLTQRLAVPSITYTGMASRLWSETLMKSASCLRAVVAPNTQVSIVSWMRMLSVIQKNYLGLTFLFDCILHWS